MNVEEKSSTNLLRLSKVFEFSAKNKTKIFDIFIQNLITFSKILFPTFHKKKFFRPVGLGPGS